MASLIRNGNKIGGGISNLDKFQTAEMPEPSSIYAGKIYQYTGETTPAFTNGFFYRCLLNDDSAYEWRPVYSQPSADIVELTSAEYHALSEEEKMSGTTYYVVDEGVENTILLQSGLINPPVEPIEPGHIYIWDLTFPIPFSEIPNVVGTIQSTTSNYSSYSNISIHVGNITTTGCKFRVIYGDGDGETGGAYPAIQWQASALANKGTEFINTNTTYQSFTLTTNTIDADLSKFDFWIENDTVVHLTFNEESRFTWNAGTWHEIGYIDSKYAPKIMTRRPILLEREGVVGDISIETNGKIRVFSKVDILGPQALLGEVTYRI